MLCLNGFELYSCWVPLYTRLSNWKISSDTPKEKIKCIQLIQERMIDYQFHSCISILITTKDTRT